MPTDQKIDELTAITGANIAANDIIPVVDISVDTTKYVEIDEFAIAMAANITGLDASKIADGTVSNAEFQYIGGITSDVQTQLDARQALDSDLTALAGLSSTGIIARTGSGTATVRTLTAGTGMTVNDGDGVSGNPTVLVDTAVVSTLTGSQTLTNKTLTNPVINGIKWATAAKTSDYTLTANDYFVTVDCTGGNVVLTLPAVSGNAGKEFVIKRLDNSINTITIDANASELIDGALTLVILTQFIAKRIICDGSSWSIL